MAYTYCSLSSAVEAVLCWWWF